MTGRECMPYLALKSGSAVAVQHMRRSHLWLQVPLKRVNQVYVIATSTKVDIKGTDVSKLEDSHFKAAEKPKEKKGEDSYFKKDTEPEEKVSGSRAASVMSRSPTEASSCDSMEQGIRVQTCACDVGCITGIAFLHAQCG